LTYINVKASAQTKVHQMPHNVPMKFTRRGWLLAGALLVTTGATAYLLTRGTPVDIAVVTQGDLRQSVVMSGRISTVERTDVASQTTARIEGIAVREGDKVRAKQALVLLRNDEAQAALVQANAAVAQAQARLRQIQTVQGPMADQQLEQARAVERQAQLELARAQDLLQQGFVSQSRVDDAMRVALSAKAVLLSASAAAQGNRTGGADLQLAQAQLEQAQAAQRAAAARLDQLILRAPADGVVIARSADPGDTAQAGKAILTLVSGSETRIQANVDEKNLKYLQLGQAAVATADAFSDRHFPARLTYIAPAVDPQRGTVELRLLVDPAVDYLRTDMTVSVEIITGHAANAVLLPTDALRRNGDGSLFVLVNRDGHAQIAPVKTGLQGSGTTEITKGLTAGERVILPGSLVAAGDKVREQNVRAPRATAQPASGLAN
jgi:HlyD family secretion protein